MQGTHSEVSEERNEQDLSSLGRVNEGPIAPKRRPFRLLFLSLAAFSIAIVVFLSRTDSKFQTLFSGPVLKAEKILGLELNPVKSALGIEMELSEEYFFKLMMAGEFSKALKMLDWGIDPNSVSLTGETALTESVRLGNIPFTTSLLKRGANPNLASGQGIFPVHIAIEDNDLTMTKLLLESGADVNRRNALQLTPLMMSTSIEDVSLLEYLLSLDAQVDLQDSRGLNALSHASLVDNAKAVAMLLDAGATQGIPNHSGKTFLELAPEEGKVLALLVERGLIVPQVEPPVEEPIEVEQTEEISVVIPEPVAKPVEKASVVARRSSAPKLTGVRAKSKPVGVWQRRKNLTLEAVSVEVRNYGGYEAKNVKVKVRVPGGQKLELEGPETLAPYAEAKYSAKPGKVITRNGKLKSFVSCDNCH